LSHSSVIILITGIGDNDDICPSDFVVDGPLGNLQECIITSGKLLLEVYYWCRLRSITRTNSERVTYDETAKKLVYTNLRNIKPLLRVDVMWHEFEQHEGLQGFLKHFKRNDKGIGKVT
jgi:hypothetical protein